MTERLARDGLGRDRRDESLYRKRAAWVCAGVGGFCRARETLGSRFMAGSFWLGASWKEELSTMTTQAPLAGRDTGRGGGNNKPPAAPSDPARQHRAAATTAGVLFITGTAAGVLSKLVISRVHDAADPLTFASTHQGTVVTGALLVLLMGLSLAFVPVVLLPILRPVNEVLALGYLVIRGAVETTCYVLVAVAWLLLVPMDTVVQGPTGRRVRLGDLLINTDATNVVVALVFCLGAGAVLRPAVPLAHRSPLDLGVGTCVHPVLRCGRPAGDVRRVRYRLDNADAALLPDVPAGDGACCLDDRARLPSSRRGRSS